MTRGKLLIIVLTGVVVLGLATAYFVNVRRASTTTTAAASPAATIDAGTVLAGAHVVFRNSVLGTAYGKLGAVSLDAPSGARALFDASCERSYAVESSGVCVTAKRGVVQTYGLSMLDANLVATTSTELVGLPSRARMSRDGSLVSTTTFVTGHSYAQASFSTETIIRRDGKALGNLETWDSVVDGRPLAAVNRNFWGVTFADDNDTFYVTAASGQTTWLMRGSISKRSMVSLRTDAECPSLSPDGRFVAYKKRLDNPKPGVWRLAVLELATGRETLLAETRSVDDQVEWLDDGHILYGLPRPGSEATTSDVWVVPADGTGTAEVFIPQASSPAVVR